MKSLQNKKVLLVGASKGIGRALALQLGEMGCDLFLVSRDEQALVELCDTINNYNNNYYNNNKDKSTQDTNRAVYRICDVSKKEEVKYSVEKALEEFGKIDIAIINSGINGSEGLDDFKSDIFKRIYDVNIYGVLYFLEYLIPVMKSCGGGIIAGVSSLADIRGFPGAGAYSSSKAAVTTILEAAYLELSRFNIKVLTIKPGFVRTNMTENNKFPMPFIISPEKAANYIIKGLKKEKILIAFPLVTKILSDFGKILPKRVFNFIFNKKNFKF